MNLKLLLPLIGLMFAGCLTESGSPLDEAPTPRADNIQEWYFVSAFTDSTIERTEEPCGGDFDYDPILYRLRGDTLDLGFSHYTLERIDSGDGEWTETSSDTLWIGGTYVRLTGQGTDLRGVWSLREHRPWNATSGQNERFEEVAAEWDFLYNGEELSITSRTISFAFPEVRLWSIKWAEYQLLDDETVVFHYVGTDSVRVTREGETASIKYKPFQNISARSTNSGRSVISVGLADSCAFAGAVVDTTWIRTMMWGEEDTSPVDFLEKSSPRAGKPGAAVRRR